MSEALVPKSRGMTIPGQDLREAFLIEYLIDFNVVRSARAVGCASITGYQMLREPESRAAVKKEMLARSEEAEVERMKIEQALKMIAYGAFSNLEEFQKTGDYSKLSPEAAMTIQEVTQEVFQTRGGESATRIKIKTADRLRALELLAKIRGLLTEKSDGATAPVTVNLNVEFE